MDFESLSNDELADVTRDLFAEFHRRADAIPSGPVHDEAQSLVSAAHAEIDVLRKFAQGSNMIQPRSGGGDKEPPGGG